MAKTGAGFWALQSPQDLRSGPARLSWRCERPLCRGPAGVRLPLRTWRTDPWPGQRGAKRREARLVRVLGLACVGRK